LSQYSILEEKKKKDPPQERRKALETSPVPEPMRANPVRAPHTQHSTQIWKEAIRTASLNPRAIVDIKYWVLHMTEGAV